MENKKTPWYDLIEWFIIVILFACMTAITFSTVVTRYIFNFTLSWAEQMSRLLFVWVSFAGISWAGRINAHNRVTVVAVIFGKKQNIAEIFLTLGDILGILFGFYMAKLTYDVMVKIYVTGQVLPSMTWCPKWVMYLPGVLGMIGMSLRITQRLWRQYFGRDRKRVSLDTIKEGGTAE